MSDNSSVQGYQPVWQTVRRLKIGLTRRPYAVQSSVEDTRTDDSSHSSNFPSGLSACGRTKCVPGLASGAQALVSRDVLSMDSFPEGKSCALAL